MTKADSEGLPSFAPHGPTLGVDRGVRRRVIAGRHCTGAKAAGQRFADPAWGQADASDATVKVPAHKPQAERDS